MKIIYLTADRSISDIGKIEFRCDYSTADKFITVKRDRIYFKKDSMYEIEFIIDSYDISKKKPAQLEFIWKNENGESIDSPKILDFNGKPSYYKLRNTSYKTFLIPPQDICISLHLITLKNATLNKMTCFIKVFDLD